MSKDSGANPYGTANTKVTHYGENGFEVILVDEPAPGIRRITLNRPEKRNALNHQLRGEVLAALEAGDADEQVKVMIVRGAGKCFSAGYDLGGGNVGLQYPFHTAGGDSQWPRHVVESWMRIWDLSKPVIAQVHGYCLAGGSELATGCDIVYVSEDAKIGYPAVRFGVPDMQFHPWLVGMRKGMEMLLTGDSLSGQEAVEYGWATRCFGNEELEEKTLEQALRIAEIPADIVAINKRAVHRQMEAMGMRAGLRAGTELCTLGVHQASFKALRIAEIPADIVAINKRAVHRQMEAMGLRAGLRAGTELCTLGVHQASFKAFMEATQGGSQLTSALQKRDEKFGDYRTAENKDE